MAKLIAKTRIVPLAGRHVCTLISVNEVENQFYKPDKDTEDKKERLEWIFSYDKKPEMQIRVWSSFNLSFYKGNKSNALKMTEALLNKTLSEEERKEAIDTDLLVGKKCFLTVKHDKKEDGEISAKVIDFEPVE